MKRKVYYIKTKDGCYFWSFIFDRTDEFEEILDEKDVDEAFLNDLDENQLRWLLIELLKQTGHNV